MMHPRLRNLQLLRISRPLHVFEPLLSAPVVITEHRKERFVLMNIEAFKEMKAKANPRRVYGRGDTSKGLAKLFSTEIDHLLGNKV
jgi:hypothetical protein